MSGYRYDQVKGISLDVDKSKEDMSQDELLARLKEFLPRQGYAYPTVDSSKEFKLSNEDFSKEISDVYLPPPPPPPSVISNNGFEDRSKSVSANGFDNGQGVPLPIPNEQVLPSPENIDSVQTNGYRYHPKLEAIEPVLFPKDSTEDTSKEILQTYLPPSISNKPLDDRAQAQGKNILTNEQFPGFQNSGVNSPLSEHIDSFSSRGSKFHPNLEFNNPESSFRKEKRFRDDNLKQRPANNDPFFVPSIILDSDDIEISREFLDSLEVKNLNRFTPMLAKSKLNDFVFPSGVPLSKSIHQFKESKESLQFGFKEKKNFPNSISRADSKASLQSDFGVFQKDFGEFNDFKHDFPKIIDGRDFSNGVPTHSKLDNKTASLIFVLLGSLSPLLQLGNQSISSPNLTNVLKHDIPASVIHIPRLTANHQFQEKEGRDFSPKSLAKSFSDSRLVLDPETCNKKYFSSDCHNYRDGFCFEDFNYPFADIKNLVKDDPNLSTKYAEVEDQSADYLVPFIQKKQEERFDYTNFNPFSYDESHWFGPEGYICPSNVTYGRPIRAINTKGKWKFIINIGDSLTQTLRFETCLFTNAPCRLVAPCFKSKCLQKYTYHRLLSFDPCDSSKGLHNDIFRFPSSCSCYAPAFQGVDDLLPEFNLKKMVVDQTLNKGH